MKLLLLEVNLHNIINYVFRSTELELTSLRISSSKTVVSNSVMWTVDS